MIGRFIGTMGGADFCKFSHAFRHGLPLSEHILQISPGKNDNLPLVTATSTAQGPGSIGLSLVWQSRPPCTALYVVSVRWPESLPIGVPFNLRNPASFRFHLAMDTLAFG